LFAHGCLYQHSRQKGFLVLLVIAFQGCATLDLQVPLNEIESPLHQGRENGFGIEMAGTKGLQVKLSEDPSQRPYAESTKHSVDPVFLLKPALNFYMWSRFTVAMGVIESKSPFIKGKVSLLHAYREDHETGRLQMALAGETSYQRAEVSGSQNGLGGATGFPWKGTSELLNYKVGLSLGMHVGKRLLPFVGYNFQQFITSGRIEHTASGGDAGGSNDIKAKTGDIRTMGLGLDWRVSSRVYITMQALQSNFEWYEKKLTEIGGHLKLSFIPK
jgi:hypothetical protein